jgi:hypothetical protein
LSTKALKTVEKKGLQVMAKEAGINLADFWTQDFIVGSSGFLLRETPLSLNSV